jgi:YVTN family beta-propeller protein
LGKATPGAIVFSPNGKWAWVTAGAAAVDVVDVARLRAVSEISSLGSVGGPAISPNGKLLLLPNSGDSQVAAIGQAAGARLADISVGAMDWSTSQLYSQYGGAAVSRDGKLAYVTNYASGNVSVIDTLTKKVVTSVETGANPVGVAVSPDGFTAYVANSFSNSVTAIDTTTYTTKQIAMPQYSYPSSIAISPDGSRVYVGGNNPMPDFGTAKCYVFVIDTSSSQVVTSIRVPYPMALTVSPDGTRVYVAAGSTSLYTISTATNTVTNTLSVADAGPTQPVTSGIAVTPDGSRLFMDDGQDNRIFEVDLTQDKVVETIRAGSTPGILAVTPDGSQVWVRDYYATSASVIDISSGTVIQSIPLGSQSYGIAFGPH